MRGSLHSQVEALYHNQANGIGISRDTIKKSGTASTLIHSDNSRFGYVGVWHRIAEYAAKTKGIKNIEDLTSEIVGNWIDLQVSKKLAPDTIGQYCSAIKKLEHALNKVNNNRRKQ